MKMKEVPVCKGRKQLRREQERKRRSIQPTSDACRTSFEIGSFPALRTLRVEAQAGGESSIAEIQMGYHQSQGRPISRLDNFNIQVSAIDGSHDGMQGECHNFICGTYTAVVSSAESAHR